MKTQKESGQKKFIASRTGFLLFILICIAVVVLFVFLISKIGTEAKQEYFEGKVLEITEEAIVVQIDSSYEDLIEALGETVTIQKADVVKECDFSKFSPEEGVRILYGKIDSREKAIKNIYAVYLLSEL